MSVLTLVDLSMLVHAMFHVGKNPNTKPPDDPYDVAERVMTKGDRLKEWLINSPSMGGKFEGGKFVAVFDQPQPRQLFRTWFAPTHKSTRTQHETLEEAETATRQAYENSSEWHSITASHLLECDDLIASMAKAHDGVVVIYSADRDYHQCLEGKRVVILKKCNKEVGGDFQPIWFTEEDLYKKHSVRPDQWAQWQAIVGAKDDVPGWNGAGPGMASKILQLPDVKVDLLDLDPRVKMNKTQAESYPEFCSNYDNLMMVRTLRTTVPVSGFLESVYKDKNDESET